ncbi:MAG: hypothetical protein R2822_08620 [Spirosomataceae bacterium]
MPPRRSKPLYTWCHDPHDSKQQRCSRQSLFSEALAKADYYINDQELSGRIQGKLAERLGDRKGHQGGLLALCENTHP